MTIEYIFGIHRQESCTELRTIRHGVAYLKPSKPPGSLTFVFDDKFGRAECKLISVSTVTYCHELMTTDEGFPFARLSNRKVGLFEAFGTKYLDSIENNFHESGGMFKNSRHFIYWDDEFLWNITCHGIEVNDIPE